MQDSSRHIIRVLSNNAVLTRAGGSEVVLVGRGIGFGRNAGDTIDESSIQQQYVEMDPERTQLLDWVRTLGANPVGIITDAVDQAADALGGLHPAVYVLLLDHIAFAVQRTSSGESIENPLLPQIREMYPDEFAAARAALRFLNTHLDVSLPEAEAGFIALHLNAARSGEAVKQPLQRANRLAGLVDELAQLLGITDAGVHAAMTRDVVALAKRLRDSLPRRNDAQHAIARDLPQDHAIASTILRRILDVDTLPRELRGETAFLAVQVHGWRQDVGNVAASKRKGTP